MTVERPPEFDCLWCGARHQPRAADDLEAWARLCPDCLGRAGENSFLRYRVREAVSARARSGRIEQAPGEWREEHRDIGDAEAGR